MIFGTTFYLQTVATKEKGAVLNYVMAHVNMYRVIGAIVIILGLYLVMCGKANDNNSFLSVDQCQIAPARELVNASRNGKENRNHEAITISK